MKDYHINIFYSDDDECYVADIPDLKFWALLIYGMGSRFLGRFSCT